MKNKTIFVIPGASPSELEDFKYCLNNADPVFIGKDVKMYKIIEGEIYEVIEKLVKQ